MDATSNRIEERSARLGRLTLWLVAWLLIVTPNALRALATLVVEIDGGGPEPAISITLEGDEGSPQQFSGRGDSLEFSPTGGAGDYRITITADQVTSEADIVIPTSGVLVLSFDTVGGDILSTYRQAGNDSVVVTARRRQEDLQTTPVSITVVDADEIRERSLANLDDLGKIVPNVDFSVSSGINGSPFEAVPFIRGIGHLGTDIFQDPGVGIYIDGVYLARAQGSVLDLLDVERVEVLRGPQGTLFGKNTLGGALNVVTRKPSGVRSGSLELKLGDLDHQEIRGGVDVPISERTFASLAGLWSERDGYARSLASGEVFNDDDRFAIRGALRFLAADNVVIDLNADYTDEQVNGLDQVMISLEPSPIVDFYNQVVASAGQPTYSQEFVSQNLFESYSGSPNFHGGEVFGIALQANATFEHSLLTSITAFRELDYDDISDRDGSPLAFAEITNRHQQEQISQELQLSGLALDDRLNWLIGGLFFTEDANTKGNTVFLQGLFAALQAAPGPIFAPPGIPSFLCNPGPPPPGLPCFGGAGNPFNFAFIEEGFLDDTRQQTDSYSLFGHVSLAASERVSLNLGLRYTLDEKELSIDRLSQPLGIPIRQTATDDWDALSPKIGVEARITPDQLLYGSISWGFKSGGFNGITQGRDVLDPFDPEEVVAYELGWKSDWLDNRLRFNAGVFFNDYTDIQFTSLLLDEGVPTFPIRNAGEAASRGFELELLARPNRRFQLTSGIGYLDTEYTELEDLAPGGATLDGTFPKSPEWTFNISPQLLVDAGDGELRMRIDFSYRSKVFHDITNNPNSSQDGFGLLGARVAYLTPGERWELAVFGTNLTDERYSQNGLFISGFGPTLVVAGEPRQWGVSARLSF